MSRFTRKRVLLTAGLGLAVVGLAIFGWSRAGVAGSAQHDHGDHGKAEKVEEHGSHHGEKAAGHGHEMASAHGGIVTMTDEFHFETAFMPDHVRIYLYDASQKPLAAEDIEGSVELAPEKGSTTSLALNVVEKETGGYLEAGSDFSRVEKGSMKVRVRLQGLPGEDQTAADYTVTYVAARAIAYTCPNHSHIAEESPGTCPKDGVELVRVTGHYGCPGHPAYEAAVPIECPGCSGMVMFFIPDDEGEEKSAQGGHQH